MVAPLDAVREQRVDDGLEPGPALARLAGRDEDRHRLDLTQAALQATPERGPDRLVADDEQPPIARERREMFAGAVEQAVLDQDVVTALAERDVDRLHRVSRTAPR